MKPGTHRQTKDLAIRVLNLNPESIDGEALQKGIEECSVEDVDRRIIAFCNNGLRLIIKGPSVLIVDRTKPFDTKKFLPIWRGPKNGDGLTGDEEQDPRSLALTEIDFAHVLFEHCIKQGETTITGEEKLSKHIAAGHIRLDAQFGQALIEEKGWVTLEFLFNTFGITWFELPGTILRNSHGHRYFLCLYRDDNGRWYWRYSWLGNDRVAGYPSAVCAS